MSIARSMDLDLVEVAADANPPVCRIMDFNRFKYETAQRAKESRRKTTNTSIKEMKYRPKIGTGDFDTKTRQVARFLGDGHKVKITIMFRGREMSHPELGKRILDHVAQTVGSVAKVEAEPKLDGRNMIMVLAPDRRNRAPGGTGTSVSAPDGPSGPSTPEATAATTASATAVSAVATAIRPPAGPQASANGNASPPTD
jgi:translation initiation factor IF-3